MLVAHPEAETRVRQDVSDMLVRCECVNLYERIQLPETDAVKEMHASFELEYGHGPPRHRSWPWDPSASVSSYFDSSSPRRVRAPREPLTAYARD